MQIDSNIFINIMRNNFGYRIVDTPLGPGLKLDCFKAFIYSNVTGAGYLDNSVYPFTTKGLTKLFYNAFDYKFVTGLFDNTSLKNTPYLLSRAKPFLFNSEKIIIPIEFLKECELKNKLDTLIEVVGNKSTDYIIQRIELSKKGNGMEPFMEYLACEFLKDHNFIVENQIPLTHGTGSPDFSGYNLGLKNDFFNKIHLIELSLIRLGIELKRLNNTKPYFIVGEAKTSTKIMKNQIIKYLKTGIFNTGIEIHPSKKSSSEDIFGIFTIGDDYIIRYKPSKKENPYLDRIYQKKYIEWIKNYYKYYLIANLTNDEFIDFYRERENCYISSKYDIINFVNNLSYEIILNKIEEVSRNVSF